MTRHVIHGIVGCLATSAAKVLDGKMETWHKTAQLFVLGLDKEGYLQI